MKSMLLYVPFPRSMADAQRSILLITSLLARPRNDRFHYSLHARIGLFACQRGRMRFSGHPGLPQSRTGLARFHWTEQDLAVEQKSHPFKLALAARSRQETTLSVKQIAERLHLGKPKGAQSNLHKFMNNSQAQTLQFDWTPNEQ